MKLYDYQQTAKEILSKNFANGTRSQIFCAPTGSGKTVTYADICRDAVRAGWTPLIVCDRKEILKQAREKLHAYGLDPSLITAGRHANLKKGCFIATIQTLTRRDIHLNVNLVIVDECHKQIFDKLFEQDQFKESLFLGITATPYRWGRMTQLSQNWEKLVQPVKIDTLIKRGFLSPCITYGSTIEMEGIRKQGGDYRTDEMYARFKQRYLISDVVGKYKKLAPNTKALVFCINVKHSKETAQAFNDAGIAAMHLDGSTPGLTRDIILDKYRRDFFKVLVNCEVLTTGYDEPGIETVIVDRATDSLPLWLQMAGRGSRTAEGKDVFTLIDMGGNVFRLGFWQQERDWSLTISKKRQ